MTEPATTKRNRRRQDLIARQRAELAALRAVLHELIRPDNGYCNQCGGHWLYRTDGSWHYADGEHRETCIGRGGAV